MRDKVAAMNCPAIAPGDPAAGTRTDAQRLLLRRWSAPVPYREAWQAMQDFTAGRTPATADELWLLEHPPVYTLGLAGRRQHLLDTGGVEVVHSDRGGQVMYHGPGQVVVYPLVDLRRRNLAPGHYIRLLEQAAIDLLEALGLPAARRAGAPGVYVEGGKIAFVGVRVRRGGCFHGLAFNVATDLTAFDGIHPCGMPGLKVCSLHSLGLLLPPAQVATELAWLLCRALGHERWHLSPPQVVETPHAA